MITMVVLIGLALAVAAALLVAARGQAEAVSSVNDLVTRTQPIDLDAFRNLINAQEEDYLREMLAPAQFRRVQRERMRAASEYVHHVAHNAALLIRLGEAGRRSPQTDVVRASEDLVNSAVQMRVLSVCALAVLFVRVVFPSLRLPMTTFADTYERTRDRLAEFGRIQHPASVARLQSAL